MYTAPDQTTEWLLNWRFYSCFWVLIFWLLLGAARLKWVRRSPRKGWVLIFGGSGTWTNSVTLCATPRTVSSAVVDTQNTEHAGRKLWLLVVNTTESWAVCRLLNIIWVATRYLLHHFKLHSRLGWLGCSALLWGSELQSTQPCHHPKPNPF